MKSIDENIVPLLKQGYLVLGASGSYTLGDWKVPEIVGWSPVKRDKLWGQDKYFIVDINDPEDWKETSWEEASKDPYGWFVVDDRGRLDTVITGGMIDLETINTWGKRLFRLGRWT